MGSLQKHLRVLSARSMLQEHLQYIETLHSELQKAFRHARDSVQRALPCFQQLEHRMGELLMTCLQSSRKIESLQKEKVMPISLALGLFLCCWRLQVWPLCSAGVLCAGRPQAHHQRSEAYRQGPRIPAMKLPGERRRRICWKSRPEMYTRRFILRVSRHPGMSSPRQ